MLSAAGSLLGSRQHGMQAATAYLCAAAVALLAGSGSVATSIQNAALLAAAVAALAPRGSLLSAMLLAAGSADWLPGAVLQGVPLALLAASWQRSSGGSGGVSGSDSGAAPHVRVVARRLAGYLCCFAATAAALGHARSALPPVVAAAVGLAGGRSEAPAVQPADLAADPLAWVGTRVAQQPPHLRDAVVLPAATLEPGLGLHWYLLAQCFPQYRCAGGRQGVGRWRRCEGRPQAWHAAMQMQLSVPPPGRSDEGLSLLSPAQDSRLPGRLQL